MERKIVLKKSDHDKPEEVYCTTYQMRNFYRQFADGFFSSLDVMNYIQHHSAIRRLKKGYKMMDVCCGRGLLLPLIRYYKPDIEEYVGVDISEKNIGEQNRFSGMKPITDKDTYYPFKVTHIISSVEDMEQEIETKSIDFVVYTSAIEHMQKKVGIKSLKNCFKLMKPGAEMFLSCPNTGDKKNPYDTQYDAHIYEWGLQELKEQVLSIGFEISEEWGLVAKTKTFEGWLKTQSKELNDWYFDLKTYLPNQWLMSFVALKYPEVAAEILLICKKPENQQKLNF